MIERIQIFLGPGRARLLLLWLGGTGLISLILNVIVDQYEWVRPAQSIIVLVFLIGAIIIVGGRMRREDKLRWAAILAPAFGLLILGVFLLPDLLAPLMGAALGWVIAGVFIFRSRAPMEYREAVKLLRKNEYSAAVSVMDRLIKAEPDKPGHYRFRAEILRLAGKLGPARRDYKKMIDLQPESAVAYNGLAEVCLQARDYPAALEAGKRAFELAPGEWVAAYNLGMIEDRTDESQAAIEHLTAALKARVPETRHRLLVQLYLARAYVRAGDLEAAQEAVEAMRREQGGLEEWQLILGSEQAKTLRDVLEEDVRTAQDLIDGKRDVNTLAGQKTP